MEEQNRRYPKDTREYGRLISQFTELQIAYAIREIMTIFPDMSLTGIAQTTNNPKR
jgi:hypothetical protein